MLATIVMLFFYIHPNLTAIFFNIYSCREIEGKGYYLDVNLDIECWKGYHLDYALSVALLGVILRVIRVPLVIMIS